jgi:hypothetical protein
MKYLFITICSLLFFSCSQIGGNSREIIEKFVNNIYISDEASIEEIHGYMTKEFIEKYNSLSVEKKKIHEQYITEFIKKVRKALTNNNEFEIISLQELEKSKLNYKKINYLGNGEVYGFVSGGENLFYFIIEDGKIHSFCSDIYLSNKEELIPYFFFEKT